MKSRKCRQCQQSKPLAEFHSAGKTYKGTPKFKTRCKVCIRVFFSQRHSERIQKYSKFKCTLCGYDKCIKAIDFHHIDPTKKETTIARMQHYSEEKVKEELTKCIPLCKNCHSEVHYGITTLILPIKE